MTPTVGEHAEPDLVDAQIVLVDAVHTPARPRTEPARSGAVRLWNDEGADARTGAVRMWNDAGSGTARPEDPERHRSA